MTDANLFLGRLLPDRFMGGAMRLQKEQVDSAMRRLAKELDLNPVDAALGIIRIVNASMAKAIRAVSLERGYDPKEFCLFGFGGASGLHCCELARELAVQKIVIPARAGILSAQGMVFAEPTLDDMQALFLRGDELHGPVLADSMRDLVDRCLAKAGPLRRSGDSNDTIISRFLNLRYQGQAYELSIPYQKNFMELFHRFHEHNFGYRLDDAPLELVSIQCSVAIKRKKPPFPRQKKAEQKKINPVHQQPVYFEQASVTIPVFNRDDLAAGSNLTGPALVIDNYTTILLPELFSLEVDELQNLMISRKYQ